MLVLAIDTSCLTATCSVTEDGKVLAELTIQQSKTHSQKLVPMLKSMLNILDKDFKDMDLFAAAIGPGSFTGLRIGAVTVKGLAYSCNKPVCGIPTLDALAYLVPDFPGLVVPMLDARNNQVYTASYHKTGGRLDRVSPYVGIPVDELIGRLRESDQKIIVLGDAVPLHMEKMRGALGERITQAPPALSFPRASSTALLAEQAFREHKAVNAFELKPMYLRKSQAERMKNLEAAAKD